MMRLYVLLKIGGRIQCQNVSTFSQQIYRSFSSSNFLLSGKPVVAAKEPFCTSVVSGKKYSWCSCGLSSKQPFCDGSHKKSGMRPLRLVADETCDVYFCGCKQTKTPPYCDGSHMQDTVQECSIGGTL